MTQVSSLHPSPSPCTLNDASSISVNFRIVRSFLTKQWHLIFPVFVWDFLEDFDMPLQQVDSIWVTPNGL